MVLLWMMFKTFVMRVCSFAVRIIVRPHSGNTYLEIKRSISFAEKQMLPDGFMMSSCGSSSYYANYGFRVPKTYGDVFAKWNGVKSDRYMSMDVYYCSAIPALNRYDFINAMTDKGGYSILFQDILMPQTIIKNRNGIFFDNEDKIISSNEALSL